MKKLGKINRKQFLVGLILLVILISIGVIFSQFNTKVKPTASSGSCKYFIDMDRDGTIYPDDLAADLERIESSSNLPYDGIVFRIKPASLGEPVSPETMMSPGIVLDSTTIDRQLAPLRNMTYKPKKLKHNFIRVLAKNNDFYDTTEWDRVANNFKVLADGLDKLRDSGFGVDGIAFDNEGPYGASCSMWNWYVGNPCLPKATSDSTLRPYQDESRARGKQVMDAMIQNSSFKDIRVLTYLDSYFSCDNANLHPWDNFWLGYELMGSFTLGMLESTVGTNAKVADGGEYSYYNDAPADSDHTFQNRYNYAKNVMPTDSACSFMTRAKSGSSSYPNFALDNNGNGIRDWTEYLSVAHGLMKGLAAAQIDNIQNNVKTALQNTDDYVWFYTEYTNSTDPQNAHPAEGSRTVWIGDDWNNQILLGRQAAADPSCGSTSPSPSTTVGSPSPSPSAASPSPSPSTSSSPTLCEPAKPDNLAGNVNSDLSVALSWRDNASNENGFSLERKLSTSSVYAEVYNSRKADVTSWTDTTVSSGSTYNYRVRAYNGCGKGVSDYSNVITVPVSSACAKPLAPDSLTAQAISTSQIDLTWADLSSNETGFALERSTSSTSGFVQIAKVGANATSYQDTGLAKNKTYYYRVRAYNDCGNSAYSKVASAKTKRWWIIP